MKNSISHSITGVSPLELMPNRNVQDKLPPLKEAPLPDRMDEILRDRDKAAKERKNEIRCWLRTSVKQNGRLVTSRESISC